jgi:gamma-glutamyl-gamma-aminobutyrate hydrolase PuuD
MESGTASPLIALTVEVLEPPAYAGRRRYQLFTEYVAALRLAGAIALPVPGDATAEEAVRLLGLCDGLLLTGGDDPDLRPLGGPPPPPECKLVPRAQQDLNLALVRGALREDLPMLGVCLGMQMMGLAHGAPFVQHLPNAGAHCGGALHRVRFARGSRLAGIAGAAEMEVASFHHQALAGVTDGIAAAGWATDGVLEAVEIPGRRFAVGVQWHPERAPDSEFSRGLFGGFAEAARDYRRQQE